jgi:nitroreductase
MRTIEKILERARWAPSGDNTQVWRFEILSDDHAVIHGFDTRHWCVYDLDGRASQLAVGALLETLSIAASALGLRADIVRRTDTPDTHLLFDVRLVADEHIKPDPLANGIESRSVQRRPMGSAPLTADERASLEAAVAPYRIIWFESLQERARIAKLNFDSAEIRLTIPEAYETHIKVIEWRARFSEDRIPELAVGVDPMTARLMEFAMKSWSRVEFFNRWLFGTFAPRAQLDYLPGIACSAHAYLIAPSEPETVDDHVAAGRKLQRLWLTVESLGMQSQPEMTPLIFNQYARTGKPFTGTVSARERADQLAARLDSLLGEDAVKRAVWVCRVGRKRASPGRSLRRPLATLQRTGSVE